MQIIKNKNFQITRREGRIFEVDCGKKSSLSLKELEEIKQELMHVGADNTSLILLTYSPDQATETMNHFDAEFFSVRALAMHNPDQLVQRMYKLLMKISKSNVPVGLFTEKEPAFHWLKSFAA